MIDRDVRDIRGQEGREDVSPTQCGAQAGAPAKVEFALEVATRDGKHDALATNPDRVAPQLDHGLHRAAGKQGRARDPNRKMLGLGQHPSHVSRQAIRRYDDETHPGHDHQAPRPRFGVSPIEVLENRNLAGDVQVVGECAEAGVDHGSGRG